MSLTARSRQPQASPNMTAAGGLNSRRGFWRRNRRRLSWWSPAVLVVLVAGILTGLAARYQPLTPGNASGGSFPGLPTATGMRWVTKYIPGEPELYVPPQRGTFAFSASMVNSGPFPITIVGISQPPGSPFTPAGPARYLAGPQWGRAELTGHPPRQVLRDVTIRPGEGVTIGIPVRIAYCAGRTSYVGEDIFLVTEKFLGFTRTIPMPLGFPAVTDAPGGQQGHPGTYCGS